MSKAGVEQLTFWSGVEYLVEFLGWFYIVLFFGWVDWLVDWLIGWLIGLWSDFIHLLAGGMYSTEAELGDDSCNYKLAAT